MILYSSYATKQDLSNWGGIFKTSYIEKSVEVVNSLEVSLKALFHPRNMEISPPGKKAPPQKKPS